ncbi:MAG: hypothetical protein CBB97_02095 [Candidatus Endolissoclinum sp. TMED37]|nr:MAG: hypothetical protein CBB97_02095 [Candidatus Endolissoclinum sp. TMED37]|tara:strand:- start:2102 stop:2818 length:717 start_codon:yes stop_codon:yes gene_type:complete
MLDLKTIISKINESQNDKIFPADFHIHTNWTDGKNSIQEMYNSALKKGVKSILYSEHVRKESSIWFENFANEIRALPKIKCLAFVGAETKIIDYSGNLDCSDIIYNLSDLVMGVVHRFPGEKGNIKKNTISISKNEAIEMEFELSRSLLKNSRIDILGHPFGMSFKRFNAKPSEKKILELIKLAKKYNCFFEINSVYHPDPRKLLSICKSIGTKFTLGSNAHNIDEIGRIIDRLKDVE